MPVPTGVQIIVFTVYVAWSVATIMIGFGIVKLLEQIRDALRGVWKD